MSKPTKWLCVQRNSDQPGHLPSLISLRSALDGWLRTQAFFMWTAKTLIRLGGCPGWSESLLGTHSFCWFCHVAAHIPLRISCWWLYQLDMTEVVEYGYKMSQNTTKPSKWSVCLVNSQISLDIGYPGWSESSLGTQLILLGLSSSSYCCTKVWYKFLRLAAHLAARLSRLS